MPAPGSLPWREDVALLLEAADAGAPDTVADRSLELIVASGAWPRTPDQVLTSIESALRSKTLLAALAPRPLTEGACRKLLRLVADRLREWVETGSVAAPEPLETWRPAAAATPVAYLDRAPDQLARWLGVGFARVDDDPGPRDVAVLRLRSGRLVALTRLVDGADPGVVLLQDGGRPAAEVVAEFLADTRLPPGVVGRRYDAGAGR